MRGVDGLVLAVGFVKTSGICLVVICFGASLIWLCYGSKQRVRLVCLLDERCVPFSAMATGLVFWLWVEQFSRVDEGGLVQVVLKMA